METIERSAAETTQSNVVELTPFDVVALKRDAQIPFPEGVKCVKSGTIGAVIDRYPDGALEVEFAPDPVFPHIISWTFKPDDLILVSHG